MCFLHRQTEWTLITHSMDALGRTLNRTVCDAGHNSKRADQGRPEATRPSRNKMNDRRVDTKNKAHFLTQINVRPPRHDLIAARLFGRKAC
jgi:hypothetical protein